MQYLKSERFIGEFSHEIVFGDIQTLWATMQLKVRNKSISTGYVRKAMAILCEYNGRFGRGFTVRVHADGEVRRCEKFTCILPNYDKIPMTAWHRLELLEVKQCLKSFLQ